MSQLHPLLEKSAFQRLEASLATIKAEEKLFILKDEQKKLFYRNQSDEFEIHKR